jgi:hypothetical protein
MENAKNANAQATDETHRGIRGSIRTAFGQSNGVLNEFKQLTLARAKVIGR